MHIIKLLRSNYDGDEYLIEHEGVYKRSKHLSREVYGSSIDKITERINAISKARSKFLYPDYVGLDVNPPVFHFPYHEESDVNNSILEEGHRIQVAQSLLEGFELFQHSSAVGFGVWGLPDLLISDRLYILPPLWVNYRQSALKLLLNRADVAVARELLQGKSPTPASDVFVLGKILKAILPERVLKETGEFINQMVDPDPAKRPAHYSRILSHPQFAGLPKALSTAVKREFVSPHIIEREKELATFMSRLKDRKQRSVSFILVRGNTRVGKSSFLTLAQNELWNEGWKTVMASGPKHFVQELLQIAESPAKAGIDEEDFSYLWNLGDSFNFDRVLTITGKLLSTVGKLAILVDDIELVDERYFRLLKSIQNMIVENEIVIAATMVREKEPVAYDHIIHLLPFTSEQSEKLLGLMLGELFVKKNKEKAQWIYKITGGYPGYIISLLNLLHGSGKLFIEEGRWVLSQNMTSIDGFGDYVSAVFSSLKEEEQALLSKIACLSEKFTTEELDALSEAIGMPLDRMQRFFWRFQDIGLIFPEDKAFRFSLREIWEQSYALCPEALRLQLHRRFAEQGTQLNKKAWHYKEISEVRMAAKVYLSASRKAFRENEGFDTAREYMEEVFQLLKPEEISATMIGWYASLCVYDGKPFPEDMEKVLDGADNYRYLYLANLILKEEYAKVEEICSRQYEMSKSDGFPDSVWVCQILFEWALMKVKTGELDGALTLLNALLLRVRNKKTDIHQRLEVLAYDLIAQAYYRKNNWQTAYSICEANITRAKKRNLTFLLPDVFVTAGNILFTFGPGYAQPLFENAIKVSKTFYSVRKTLQPTLELAFGFLYSGEIPKMFDYLEKAREIAQIFNEKDALSRSYIIEGLYHAYNKQWEEALEDYDCARRMSNNRTFIGMAARLTAMLYLFNGDYLSLEKLLETPHEAMMEYGFEDVISIHRARTPESIRSAFEFFKKNNQLWQEEVALAFVDKLTEHLPDALEQHLESTASELIKSHTKLSLAMIYETMALFYEKTGNVKKSAKFARDAYDLYKQSSLNQACKWLRERFFDTEAAFEDLMAAMSSEIHTEGIYPQRAKETFDKLEKSLVKLNNEISVLRQIVNFSKILTASSDPKEVLDQFTNWITASIPVNRAGILVIAHQLVLYRSTIVLDATDSEDLVQEMLTKKSLSAPDPFECRTEFFIDDTKKAILYISNRNLRLDNEEYEKYISFIDYLEPIMSMAIGNAISYKSSILDPLTRLYTRWYFNQRLDEEMDKALRMNSPLSVVMGDLDDFKQFNDRYGHKTGDEILVTVAQSMRNNCRKYDIIGRYGGEEFILILPNTTGEEGYRMAERIRKSIEEETFLPKSIKEKTKGVPKTISFGVASTDKTRYENHQALIVDADKALYYSKNSGKNRTTKFWVIGEDGERKETLQS